MKKRKSASKIEKKKKEKQTEQTDTAMRGAS